MFTALATIIVFTLGQASQPDQPDEADKHEHVKVIRLADTVPPMKVSAWIPKEPTAIPGGPQTEGSEKFFVVHFWSPGDPASRACVPYMAMLQSQFGARGLEVIALSNDDEESLTRFTSTITLPYAIAADDSNDTTEAWLAGVPNFPYTFVIDRTNHVVWKGDSMVGVREAVAGVARNTLTLEVVRKSAATDIKINELTATMTDLINTGDAKGALKIADKIIATDPLRIESWTMRRAVKRRTGPGAKRENISERMRKAMWNSVPGLDALLTGQWAEKSLAERDPLVMLQCAERMAELTNREDPFALASLAKIQHELGKHDEAIKSQTLAVDLIVLDPDDEFHAALEYYKRIKDAAAGRAPASAPTSQESEL